MTWVHAVLWGLFGSFAVEGLDFWAAIRRQGVWPWQAQAHGLRTIGALGYLVAELVRLVIGGGLAGASMLSGQITTQVGAIAVGIAAPLIVERISRQIPLTDSSQDTLGSEAQSTVSSTAQQRLPDRIAAGDQLFTPARSELDNQRTPTKEHRSCDDVEQVAPQGDQCDQAKE
jgi:hypothetical protein